MSTVELMERLAEEDIPSERKSVYDDVRILKECGYPVEIKRTRVNEYYVDDHSFSTAELRMLMDTVQAANFLSVGKSKELTMKIAALGGNAKGERLKGITYFVSGKRKDDYASEIIETLQKALERRRQVRFRYFDLNVDKQRAYRTRSDGTPWYVVSPKGLVCRDDNYYMVAVMSGHDKYINFRVDRMSDMEILRDKVEVPAWSKALPLAKFVKSSVGMYSGEPERVTMVGKNDPKVINMVLDKFGYDVNLVDRHDGTFFFVTEVQVSPLFFSWLFQTEDNVRLYGPQSVCDKYRASLRDELDRLTSEGDNK